jgi:hypothetical protein
MPFRTMTQRQHGGGFFVDAAVRIEADDRGGRERLWRYCARPPFALDRLRESDPEPKADTGDRLVSVNISRRNCLIG